MDALCIEVGTQLRCLEAVNAYLQKDGPATTPVHRWRGCFETVIFVAVSCNELGRIYETGVNNRNEPDYVHAFENYTLACTRGAPLGCTNMAYMLERGFGVKMDTKGAMARYEEGCAKKVPTACNNLGWMWFKGHGIAPDLQKAEGYFTQACEVFLGRGCVNLGAVKEHPKRKDGKDTKGAAKSYRTACELNEAKGCTSLGRLLSAAGDKEGAFRYYKMACDMRGKDPRGCNNAGALLEDPASPLVKGVGMTGARVRAALLYQEACEADYALGCRNLADLAEKGQGLAKDAALAAALRARADELSK